MIKRLLCSLFYSACAILVQPAFATPPDAVSVRDEIFGISGTHVFLLRNTVDNLGIYATQADIRLVMIDRMTGQETYWPVYRGCYTPGQADESTRAITTVPLENSVNPFEKLRELHGVPLDASERGEGTVIVGNGVLTVTYGADEDFRTGLSDLRTRITATVDRLLQELGDYSRPGGPVTVRDLLSGIGDEEGACAFSAGPVYRGFDSTTSAHLLRVTCGDGADELSNLSLFFLLPLPLGR